MRESIEAMKEIWTEPQAEYHGEFVNFGLGQSRCRSRIRQSMSAALFHAARDPLWRRPDPYSPRRSDCTASRDSEDGARRWP